MRRRWFVCGAVVVALSGWWVLGIGWEDVWPGGNGWRLAGEFGGAALRPALVYQDGRVGEAPFLGKLIGSVLETIRYAVVAMSLAVVVGLVGGVLGSRAWWGTSRGWRGGVRAGGRLMSTALRSVHELMWALLLVTALGTSPLAAVLALALPYGGTLAKVFSELLDEAPQSAGAVGMASGGRRMAVFIYGIFPRALPDLVTYGFYRLECAVRSSAILGFVGIPTLGYEISTAFEDGHYREIWSYLYALILVVWGFEWVGARLRRILASGVQSRRGREESGELGDLWKKRGSSRFLRATGIVVVFGVAASWGWGVDWESGVSLERRWENLVRFTGELRPFPVRENGDWGEFWPWAREMVAGEGLDAIWRTLNLGTLAALLAGGGAVVGILYAARTLATRDPRGVSGSRGWGRGALGQLVRLLALVTRSLPEYLLAFLLLQILGPTVWALVMALAIHNAGILMRLGAEVVDNAESGGAQAALAQGASREATYLSTLLPEGFNRMVLFLFYRWETCIREATILGMLGVGSLGFLISEARVRFYYDEMLFWILCGGGLVFLGDLLSDWVRFQLKGDDVATVPTF